MSTKCLTVALCFLAFAVGRSSAQSPAREAVARSLPLLKKSAAGHIAHRTCFACHSQALPLLAAKTSSRHGFAPDAADAKTHAEFISRFLDQNRERYLEGKGQGGQADTAGYALFALEMCGAKPDAVTSAVIDYLLDYQKESDHWRTSANRPPSELSPFTTSYFALRALRVWGGPEHWEGIQSRHAALRRWVRKATAQDTEDRVFRIGVLHELDEPAAEIRKERDALLALQREDGGWAQRPDMASDAYATGSVLVMLHEIAGLPTAHNAYRGGVDFLLNTQLEDGSWVVRSRSKPFQTYFETGFPHGPDQFISTAASGWAAAALALSLPKKDVAQR